MIKIILYFSSSSRTVRFLHFLFTCICAHLHQVHLVEILSVLKLQNFETACSTCLLLLPMKKTTNTGNVNCKPVFHGQVLYPSKTYAREKDVFASVSNLCSLDREIPFSDNLVCKFYHHYSFVLAFSPL